MKLRGNTILITGGATGIGFALATRFSSLGNEVIICGRRKSALAEAKGICPALHAISCDISSEEERSSLFARLVKEFPNLNVLINNAGIQNRPLHITEQQDWRKCTQEMAINFEAPVHLSQLFVPFLSRQNNPTIINISSGLAFVPLAQMPIYCATKAALHSFTLSLRQQLLPASIKVIELIPPAVNTDLGGKGLHDNGVPLNEYADFAIASLGKDEVEIGYGFSDRARLASREQLDEMFRSMNK